MKDTPKNPIGTGETRREFIKVATTATAMAATASVVHAQSAKSAAAKVTVAGGASESSGPWIPPETPPSLSGIAAPKELLLHALPSELPGELPANALIPHYLGTLAAGQNLAATPLGSLDDEQSGVLERQVVDAYTKMRRAFRYILNQVAYLIAQMNRGTVAAAQGQGSTAYEQARSAYLEFVRTLGGYDQAISSLVVEPTYGVNSPGGQTGLILGTRVTVVWRNTHSDASGFPIPH